MKISPEAARAKTIFLKAVESCASDDVTSFLDRECAGNEELRRQVDRLLAGHRKDVDLVQQGEAALKQVFPTLDQAEPPARPGSQIGPYKLGEQIGEGGFGAVYAAEQTAPLKRRVALKIIKPGMDTREVVARFEAERQALAIMDHPHIAKVLDAGSTESGRPYFVMELVKGVPITEYCNQCRLPTRERLTLFLDVCRAVQHAHQKGIIHRDLKPSNVLVAVQDGSPVPKIIDFGVAKALNQRLTEQSFQTRFTQMLGTPMYMSPEQAELRPLDVDTRGDIYSLGVLLYELLTGTTPFEKQQITDASFDELRRIIREEEPLLPSRRLSTLEMAQVTTISEQRRTEPEKLCRLIHGELDWIVMKALDKDRGRRYETASAFAADVERYLSNQPIQACPPSAWYQFRKLVRRQRATLAVAAAIALCLLVGAAGTTWQSIVAITQRDRAIESEATARAEFERAEREATSARLAADEANHARSAAEASQQVTERTLVNMYAELGLTADDRGDLAEAMLWFAQAAQTAAPDSDQRRLNQIRAHLWGEHLAVPVRAFQQSPNHGRSRVLKFHPSGRFLLSQTHNQFVVVWNIQTGRAVELPVVDSGILCADWSPNGERLALGTADGTVHLLRSPIWSVERETQHNGPIRAIAFSSDSSLLAYGSDVVGVMRCGTGEKVTPDLTHPQSVGAIVFSLGGEMLATACEDKHARIYRINTNESEPIVSPVQHRMRVFDGLGTVYPQFVDGDRKLAVYHNDIDLVDIKKGEVVTRIDVPSAGIRFNVAGPDGRMLLSGGWDAAVVYDSREGSLIDERIFYDGQGVNHGVFRPDGLAVAVAGAYYARQHSVFDHLSPFGPVATSGVNSSLAYSPDGRLIAAGDFVSGMVVIWRTVGRSPRLSRQTLPGTHSRGVSVSRDGQYLVPRGSSSWFGTLKSTRVLDAKTLQPVGPELKPGGLLIDTAFSPDIKHVVTVSVPDQLDVWDWTRAVRVADTVRLPSEPRGVQYSESANALAVNCHRGEILVLDPASLEIRFQLQHGPPGGSPSRRWDQRDQDVHRYRLRGEDGALKYADPVVGAGRRGMQFSPDGKWLLTYSYDNTVHVWNPVTGELRYPPIVVGKRGQIDVSQDGKFLATTFTWGKTAVWDLDSGKRVAPKVQLSDKQNPLVFSPDTRLLAAQRADNVGVTDWRSQQGANAPFLHTRGINRVAFTADSQWLMTVEPYDRCFRIWDWRTGRPITPRITIEVGSGGGTPTFTHSIRGNAIFLSGASDKIYSYSLEGLGAPPSVDAETQYRLATLVSAHRIEDSGRIRLTPAEWLETFHKLRETHPDLLKLEEQETDGQAWHVDAFQHAISAQYAYGAQWHFDRISPEHPQWSLLGKQLVDLYLRENMLAAAQKVCDGMLEHVAAMDSYWQQLAYESMISLCVLRDRPEEAIGHVRDLFARQVQQGMLPTLTSDVRASLRKLARERLESDRPAEALRIIDGFHEALVDVAEQIEHACLMIINGDESRYDRAVQQIDWRKHPEAIRLLVLDEASSVDREPIRQFCEQRIGAKSPLRDHLNLAAVELSEGRFAQAIERLMEVHQRAPQGWLFRFHSAARLAICHARLGNVDESERWRQAALDHSAEAAPARFWRMELERRWLQKQLEDLANTETAATAEVNRKEE